MANEYMRAYRCWVCKDPDGDLCPDSTAPLVLCEDCCFFEGSCERLGSVDDMRKTYCGFWGEYGIADPHGFCAWGKPREHD